MNGSLLTTRASHSVDDAQPVWVGIACAGASRLAVWCSKTGCRIEDLRTTRRATRARRAINLVITWRIILMTLLGRPARTSRRVLLTEIEVTVLNAFARQNRSSRRPTARCGAAGGPLGRLSRLATMIRPRAPDHVAGLRGPCK
ncbi:MAG: hypothetical protein IPJ48_10870 [Propionivibrio sp.]|uniref:Uncharacterized protein n=1 Tax=Candidatus Propionivibrio dominans TaxID=2954373 RepID=A0A9D7FD96_9RHOO|nr:hypothetical protein [Candidatus Propionivibrio dominans]